MTGITWRENQVISVEAKNGICVLAQMLHSLYILFYNVFQEGHDWDRNMDLEDVEQLFCVGVITRQFLKYNNIAKQPIKPREQIDLPRHWIKLFPLSEPVTLWEGTPRELTVAFTGKGGGSLIEKDITLRGFHDWRVVVPKIDPSDAETIDNHEITDVLHTYPSLNERLYLCYLFCRNVDPRKDLAFGREIPVEYEDYLKIFAIRRE